MIFLSIEWLLIVLALTFYLLRIIFSRSQSEEDEEFYWEDDEDE